MLRDPPHYLKPLTTTSTPKRLLWLMCRGLTHRRREHYETHFHAAALGSTRWREKSGERVDTLNAYATPAALWEAAAARCPVGKRAVLFTWDLAEQMRLSQMLTHLPKMGWTLDKIVLEPSASWCLLRNERRSLMCCDLRSWCPVSWDKIVGDLSATVEVGGEVWAGINMARDVCERRAQIVREAVLQILSWIEGENLGQFRPTGSGQSFTAYRRRFLTRPLLVHDDVPRLLAERAAMHTGRAEAWRVGLCTDGPFIEYDLHAAYANIGRECEVPARARSDLSRPSVARIERAMNRYAVLANVTVNTDVECLPYRVSERTLWPVGQFTTNVWEPELRLALEYCRDVRINHAWLYQRAPALRNFCDYVLAGMDGQTQVYGLVPQRVLKHWSRCLVGRLGLRYRSWHRFGPQVPPDVRLVTYDDLDEGTRTDMLLAGTSRLLLGDMTESRDSLPQVPGWIMSECRRRLWNMMADMWGLVMYVDTDSVILRDSGDAPAELTGREHSASERWVRKGTYNRLTIHGPRMLHVGSDRRFAGLPLSAKQSAPLEFDGEIMRSVKHSMRNGELDLVVSVPRRFHITPMDLRREHNPDGSTSPYRIEET